MPLYRPCVFHRQEFARLLTHNDVVHRDRLSLPDEGNAKAVAVSLTKLVMRSVPNVQPGIEIMTFEKFENKPSKVLSRYVFDMPVDRQETANVRSDDNPYGIDF